MIIDFHTHAFPDELEGKIVEAIVEHYGIRNLYPCTIKGLLSVTSNFNVDVAVIQIFANSPKNVYSLNDWGAQVAGKYNQRLYCFGTIHPDMSDPEVEIERIFQLGLKGIKFQPTAQRFYPDDRRLFKIYEKANEMHLPLMFHAGEERGPVDEQYAHPRRFIQILESFPRLILILAHMGGYRTWEHVGGFSNFKNAYFDTSAATLELKSDKLVELISLFGGDHVLFGSDFPWFEYEKSIKALADLDIQEEEKEKIMWENGANILEIKKSGKG